MTSKSVRIPLTQGKVAIVDAEDADAIMAHKWSLRGKYAGRYLKKGEAPCDAGRRIMVYMHQVVSRCEPGLSPDHRNRDKLDNRKANLRCATASQNKINTELIGRKNTSGFRGVSPVGAKGKWLASIKVNQKQKNLGRFNDAKTAARAYDRAALELHGEFAVLNFPEDSLTDT